MLSIYISHTNRISIREVIQKVQVLFQGNTVLLNAFYTFLPETVGSNSIDGNAYHYAESEIAYVAPFFLIVDMPDNLPSAF